MQDSLIRATALDGKLRAFAVRTTGVVEEARRRHGLSPTAAAALGRTMAAGAMMGAMLKGEEKLTLQIKGGGPIGQIVVDANAKGEVRGYVDNPAVDLPLNRHGKLDVAGAVGTNGSLYVIKDLGLKEPYRGSVPIISGELGEDFTHYFATSEQTPSAVGLGVLVDVDRTIKVSGGFLLQLLPGVTDEEITALEQKLADLPSVTALLEKGATLEELLSSIIDGPIQFHDRLDIRFHCPCSKERVSRMLVSLGKEELETILREDGRAEVVCHFCNEAYTFEENDLREIIGNMER